MASLDCKDEAQLIKALRSCKLPDLSEDEVTRAVERLVQEMDWESVQGAQPVAVGSSACRRDKPIHWWPKTVRASLGALGDLLEWLGPTGTFGAATALVAVVFLGIWHWSPSNVVTPIREELPLPQTGRANQISTVATSSSAVTVAHQPDGIELLPLGSRRGFVSLQSKAKATYFDFDVDSPISMKAGELIRIRYTLTGSDTMGIQLRPLEEDFDARGDMQVRRGVGGPDRVLEIPVPSDRRVKQIAFQLGENAWGPLGGSMDAELQVHSIQLRSAEQQ